MSTFDPTDPDSQARAKCAADLRKRMEKKDREADFRWLMSSKRGRRIVWWLMEQAGVFRLSFSTNAMQMAFNEGNRNLGNQVLTLIHEQCPELYPTMVKENTDDNRNPDDERHNDH